MNKLAIVCVALLFRSVVSQTDQELWEAAKEGTLDEVNNALGTGANPNWRHPSGNRGWTSLMVASANNHPAVVSALLEGGADIDMKDTNHGASALHWAAITNSPEVAKVLLDAGADKDMRGDDGITVLFAASEQGSTSVVKELIEHGADVNLLNGRGWFMDITPLMAASHKGHLDIVKALIGANANVRYSANTHGMTALHMAMEANQQEIVDLLLQNEFNKNKQNLKKSIHQMSIFIDSYTSPLLDLIYQFVDELIALFSI